MAARRYSPRLCYTSKPLCQTLTLKDKSSYVHSWLVQTRDDTLDIQTGSSQVANAQRPHRVLERTVNATRHALELDQDSARLDKNRTRQDLLSDSSLLEPMLDVQIARPKARHMKRRPPTVSEPSAGLRKRLKTKHKDFNLSNNRDASIPERAATYERRARYKTREDRYDLKNQASRRCSETKISTQQHPEKKAKPRATKTSELIMRQFSSKSVGQDRLTMRPHTKIGLFNNGRASSPSRRRGLPDLAFSEMDFLQRTARYNLAERPNKTPSGHIGKKRKASQIDEEVSTFFKPTAVSPKQLLNQQDGQQPTSSKASSDVDNGRAVVQLYGLSEVSMNCSSVSQQIRSPSYRVYEGCSNIHRAAESSSQSQALCNPAVNITWSTSKASHDHNAIVENQGCTGFMRDSPVSESMWRSIKATGVLRGTIIDPTLHFPEAMCESSSRKSSNRQIREGTTGPGVSKAPRNPVDPDTSDVALVIQGQLSSVGDADKVNSGLCNRRASTRSIVLRCKDDVIGPSCSIRSRHYNIKDTFASFRKKNTTVISRSVSPRAAQNTPSDRSRTALEALSNKISPARPIFKTNEIVPEKVDAQRANVEHVENKKQMEDKEQLERPECFGPQSLAHDLLKPRRRSDLSVNKSSWRSEMDIQDSEHPTPSHMVNLPTSKDTETHATGEENAPNESGTNTGFLVLGKALKAVPEVPRSPIQSWIVQCFRAKHRQPLYELAASESLYLHQIARNGDVQEAHKMHNTKYDMFRQDALGDLLYEPIPAEQPDVLQGIDHEIMMYRRSAHNALDQFSMKDHGLHDHIELYQGKTATQNDCDQDAIDGRAEIGSLFFERSYL